MLRRPPTTLTLTSEDIASYEDRRSGQAHPATSQMAPSSVTSFSFPRPTIFDPPPPQQHHSAHRRAMSPSPPGSTDTHPRLNFADYEDSDEDEEVGEVSEDDEMADYDPGLAGGIQSMPSSGRLFSNHHQMTHSGSSSHARAGAVTPTFSNHANPSAPSHIPHVPQAPPPGSMPGARAAAAAAQATTRHQRIAGTGAARGGAQTQISQPGYMAARGTSRQGTAEPEGRVTRSREERIGVAGGSGAGTRRRG